jgi:hypothetical protein
VALTGRRPTPDEYDAWRARSVEAYAQDELAAGRVSAEDALAQSAASYDEDDSLGYAPTALQLRKQL